MELSCSFLQVIRVVLEHPRWSSQTRSAQVMSLPLERGGGKWNCPRNPNYGSSCSLAKPRNSGPVSSFEASISNSVDGDNTGTKINEVKIEDNQRLEEQTSQMEPVTLPKSEENTIYLIETGKDKTQAIKPKV